MRSRYAAFALGLGAYLVKTLAKDHADRAHPEAELVRALSEAKARQRFLGLTIVHTEASGDRGEVLFFARIFLRGADRSFAELSTFAREQEEGKAEEKAWRYVDGTPVPRAALPEDLATLTRASFLEALRAGGGSSA
jgi:uncharacterized protein YchJ